MNNTMEPQTNNKNYKMLLNIFAIILGMGIILGVSYAIFRTTDKGEKTNIITTGNFGLEINDTSASAISMTNALPMTFEEGMKQAPYTFTLTNTGDYAIDYQLGLENMVEETEKIMPTDVVRYVLLEGENPDITSLTNADTKLISQGIEKDVTDAENVTQKVYYVDAGIIKAGESKQYTLYMWIDHEATTDIVGTKFKVRARADGEAAKIKEFKEPTAEELAAMKPYGDDQYIVAEGENIQVFYAVNSENSEQKEIQVNINDSDFYDFLNQDMDIEFEGDPVSLVGGIWYINVSEIYSGAAPFSKSDLTTIHSESYLDYVISLFE